MFQSTRLTFIVIPQSDIKSLDVSECYAHEIMRYEVKKM